MASNSTSVGCGLFILGNCFLAVGLFTSMLSWRYEIKPSKDWFEDHPQKESFGILIDYMPSQTMTMVPNTERSLLMRPGGVVWWLADEAHAGRIGYLAPVALLAFGVLVPAIKIGLLVRWAMQTEKESNYLSIASKLSRWTATDAAATAVVVGIALRAGIQAKCGVGYACYVIYCMLSTIGLWIMEERKTSREFASRGWWTSIFRQEQFDIRVLPMVSMVSFVALYAVAASWFAMARISVVHGAALQGYISKMVHGEMEKYQAYLPLIGLTEDNIIEGFAERTPLPSCEASLIESVHTLMSSGEPFTVFGCALLFICVLLVPVLQAFMATGFAISRVPASDFAQSMMQVASDFVMLDVLVVGLYIACIIIRSVHQLLQVELLPGFWMLAFVAVAFHAHQWICKAVFSQKDISACV